MTIQQFESEYRRVLAYADAATILQQGVGHILAGDVAEDVLFWDLKRFVRHVVHLARAAGVEV